MKDEPPSQCHLAGLRLQMADAEVLTKHLFRFVDASRSVAFAVDDAMTYGPRVFRGALELRSGALHTDQPTSPLEQTTAMPPDGFERAVHFDPGWAFRGTAGLERAWVDAVLASDLAGTSHRDGTDLEVHDRVFDAPLKARARLGAQDSLFRTAMFRGSDVDLLLLRPPART